MTKMNGILRKVARISQVFSPKGIMCFAALVVHTQSDKKLYGEVSKRL